MFEAMAVIFCSQNGPNRWYNMFMAAHTHPPTMPTWQPPLSAHSLKRDTCDITVIVKNVAQNSEVLSN